MARFNFKRIDKDTRCYIDLFNEYDRPNTVIIQSSDIVCRFCVEVVNSNIEVEFGDFLLNYLPFSKKVGNSLINRNI